MIETIRSSTRLIAARPLVAIGAAFLTLIVTFAVFAPWIAPFGPDAIDPVNRLLPPGGGHLMGTDHFGRDTFSRVVYGSRLALLIGVGVVVFALGTGVPIGVLSALYPKLGRVLMRMVDVLMSFPSLLLALGLIVILGQGVFNAILAIGLIYLTTTARIVYGVALRLRAEPYVEAARSMGAGTWWVVTRHILPNMISPLMVQASFVFAFAQLGAAALDFLGLGAPPDVPSWGNMLAESRIYITRASWLLLWPGLMIVLTAFSLNLVGDWLRDRMDPRFREMVGK
ncbi:ABC transporter permease [Oceaniovalibus sp. ACAM 378]|jgi:peptide/nickel transport system permease protein|uniref:ABC transporter permease n=1 Tax=Oceaniovalibus sp. ACAM 378 TaxID=2599923 RepID=UPI0011DACB18|nr:ABC transporter permease [Oceaniovalibus sp. ACAM 378]TYB88649.1 ABC transporter permease [Oceaniovalibus sp. ACAM 378]